MGYQPHVDTHDGESPRSSTSPMIDRVHLCIVRRERIDEWIEEYLKWYKKKCCGGTGDRGEAVLSTLGWIGFHIEMFPLWHIHRTQAIPHRSRHRTHKSSTRIIDDNPDVCNGVSFLASEGIVANRKIDDATVYNKWWKQPDKYKVFGVGPFSRGSRGGDGHS